MATIPIIVKHKGTKYDVDLDPAETGEILKLQLFSLTGVEPEKQKFLIKGGQLKDDTDLSSLNAKPKQVFTLMGSATAESAAMVAPVEKPKFLEDMSEAELAKQEGATPAGLQNLGNTCYMNSTLQVLKSMPELQQELLAYKPSNTGQSLQSLAQFGLGGMGGSSTDLVGGLRELYKQMSETQEAFPPMMFLNALRTAYPQFAQKSRTGQGYAQQDAEEAWSQILYQLREKLKQEGNTSSAASLGVVEKYMEGSFETTLAPPAEAAEMEEVKNSTENFMKLNCHIDTSINHLAEGIKAGLTEEIEKKSEALGHDAVYTKTSKVSRLPKYLTVQFVRFYWRKDTQKKAKILRKVTFQEELDVTEYCTDDLRKRLVPVRDKIRHLRKDEQDMERARKRQKIAHKQEEDRKHDEAMAQEAAPIAKLKEKQEKKDKKEEEKGGDLDVYKTDAEYEAEKEAAIKAAKKEVLEALDPELAADDGANKSGLYELRGVIAHQGASADSGHYTSFVKKEGRLVDDPKAPRGKRREEDGKWWWFNDDKVSEVDSERIVGLSGGGEFASALILLYRAIDLPSKEEIE